MSNYNKVRVLKGWEEYDLHTSIPNLRFIACVENKPTYQHIIKNHNNPRNFTVEMFDGTIGKKQL